METAAAVEAAGVTTSSALRRAELEEETDGMLEALINRYKAMIIMTFYVYDKEKPIFVRISVLHRIITIV